ncbi:MAG: hypothetical protein R2737_05930 [Candidatus Nanopelagicales bacterium]
MSRADEYPHYVRGLSAAGADELRAAMATFAEWQVLEGRRLDPTRGDAEALASDLRDTLTHPEHAFDPLSPEAQDRVAVALGLPPSADWVPREPVPPGTPSYARPSWEKDVYAVLFLRQHEPPPVARPIDPDARDHSADWPQLAGLDRWRRTRDKDSVTRALASALGRGWTAREPVGPYSLPRLGSTRGRLVLVAVPAGDLTMGLTPAERRDAGRRATPYGPEAAEHLKAATATARPVRQVAIAPFLCAQTPVLQQQAGSFGLEGDAANPHHVVRATSRAAAAATPEGFRLPSEAEWEWVARAGGSRAWLSGDEPPPEWAARVLAAPLAEEEHPFGILGLGWGGWLDDGWHPSYRGAPTTSRAWGPMSRPETVRGGALTLWPWQSAEVLLLHAALRDRAGAGAAYPVRWARDLPPRG